MLYRIFFKNINALSNDKNTGFNMTVIGTIFTKEADKFTPFLKFGSAVKDPKHNYALRMVLKNSINSAVRRIYSGMCVHFFDVLHFLEKNEKKLFWNQSLFGRLSFW